MFPKMASLARPISGRVGRVPLKPDPVATFPQKTIRLRRQTQPERHSTIPTVPIWAMRWTRKTTTMADDKLNTDIRDRIKVAGGEDYEIDYLVEKAGITREQARELIKRYGNNRETLMKHAKNLV